MFTMDEIFQTIRMIELEHFDIRTVTLGLSLRDCINPDVNRMKKNIYKKITTFASNQIKIATEIEEELGIPIVNKRISITPAALLVDTLPADRVHEIALILDKSAKAVGVDFIGGYSALVHKGFTRGDLNLVESIPRALSETDRVCSSVNVGTTKAGLNMDAVYMIAETIKKLAEATASKDAIGCAKFVVFANAVEDNPFMAGAMHGIGEPEAVLNLGISGPGVVASVVRQNPEIPLGQLMEEIKKTVFKITRVGELIGREVARRMEIPFGIIDLSLAPTPAPGDSVADILEGMGLERTGAPGTTAALAMLTDAVKKGGAMASSYVGGMSGAFIPVSEDQGMIDAVKEGALTLEKLEAMTSVCSVGLDMIAIPGDTSAETIAGIIADECAIGIVNRKTTGVRIIPVPGKKVGDFVEFGGLLGSTPIMAVNKFSCEKFIKRGGRFPAPIQSLRN